jgi:hypothetical protein
MDDSAMSNRIAAATAGNGGASTRPGHARVFSTPAHPVRRMVRSSTGPRPGERTALLRRYSLNMTETEMNTSELNVEGGGSVAGGTILGIHNLAIVFPQFFVSIAASIIFKIVDGSQDNDTLYLGKNGVSWVLRFAGIAVLVSIMHPSLPTGSDLFSRLEQQSLAVSRPQRRKRQCATVWLRWRRRRMRVLRSDITVEHKGVYVL